MSQVSDDVLEVAVDVRGTVEVTDVSLSRPTAQEVILDLVGSLSVCNGWAFLGQTTSDN